MHTCTAGKLHKKGNNLHLGLSKSLSLAPHDSVPALSFLDSFRHLPLHAPQLLYHIHRQAPAQRAGLHPQNFQIFESLSGPRADFEDLGSQECMFICNVECKRMRLRCSVRCLSIQSIESQQPNSWHGICKQKSMTANAEVGFTCRLLLKKGCIAQWLAK